MWTIYYLVFSSTLVQYSLRSFKVFFLIGPCKSTKYSRASLIEQGVGKGCLIAPFLVELGLCTNANLYSSSTPSILAHYLTLSSLF